MLCSIALTSHFPLGSVCREANLGYVTQCGLVPPLCSATALCFPRPLLKHKEKKHMDAEANMVIENVILLSFPALTRHNHILET